MDEMLQELPTRNTASRSYRDWSGVILVETFNGAYELTDEYVNELVQNITSEPSYDLEKMTNYGHCS